MNKSINQIQKMKTRIFYFSLCIAAMLFAISGCKKHDYAEGTLSPIIAVSDLRFIYKGTDVTLSTDNMEGATDIIGTVISHPDSGNAPAGLVILQNYRRGVTRGIALAMGAESTNYKFGDSLRVKVEGSTLGRVDGSLQITGLTAASVQKISGNNIVVPRTVSTFTIKAKPDEYENTLVQINSTTISPAPKPTDIFAGDRFLVNGADSILMHTEATASYAKAALPASATVAGIVLIKTLAGGSAPTLQILPRLYSDFSKLEAPADPNGVGLGKFPVIITGFVADTKGGDGNYEYIQLRATRNIDFTKTPMALVTCTNGGTAAPNAGDAPGGGWATGGGRTYKFNLNTGTVTKGEFFYVGGSNKKINGPNTTDISSAKWIRSIAYVTNDGDGFGSASGGIFPNSGNAGGIAVFATTNVVETTIPVDVVIFGGTGKTTIYNATTNKGYRVVDNDHYLLVDPATGTQQPFVYQGTNTYTIAHPTVVDVGNFFMLGGTFDSVNKVWITPRGKNIYTLSTTSTLAEIETGANVTVVQ